MATSSTAGRVYASYNRGYRSGAFNGGGYTGSAGITCINPEQVNAYEVGLKGKFIDDKLTLSAAGFFYDYKNQQLQDLRENAVAVLVNAPKSQIYGAEVEAVLRASDWLTFNASGGYLHTEYKELTLKNTSLAGNRLPFAPEFTAQGGFDLSLYRNDGGALVFSPHVAYFSQSNGSRRSTAPTWRDLARSTANSSSAPMPR
ncbi:TonB-dependent receptor domain-containing protein [Sphingomonas sp. MMS24-JH45]